MKFKFRGVKFFFVVAFLYIVLSFFYPEKTVEGLSKAVEILRWILPIFAVVIFFTAAIHYFMKPKEIARHLGSESGLRGWMIALAAGVISHGPMYAWYPMIEDLKKHGLKQGLIATFFYARSIKLPLLPLMIEYFGLAFTATLSLYVLIASLLQGVMIEWWCRGCEAESADNRDKPQI